MTDDHDDQPQGLDGFLARIFDPAAIAWMDQAACRHMPDDWHPTAPEHLRRRRWVDQFYPSRGDSSAFAMRICARCPVADQCRDHAVTTTEKHGVWGGASERARRRLRRDLRAGAA